jgi:hypothetical protein
LRFFPLNPEFSFDYDLASIVADSPCSGSRPAFVFFWLVTSAQRESELLLALRPIVVDG